MSTEDTISVDPRYVPHSYLLSLEDEHGYVIRRQFYLRHPNGALVGQPFGSKPFDTCIRVSAQGLFEVKGGSPPLGTHSIMENLRTLFLRTLPIYKRMCANDEAENSWVDREFLEGLLDSVLSEDTVKQACSPYAG